MDEKNTCPQYGLCLERHTQTVKEVESLKQKVEKLETEVSDIKIQQTKDSERVINLFRTVDEIKKDIKEIVVSIKELGNKMDKQINSVKNKPDTFKEALTKFGLELIRYALIGGLLYAVANGVLK